MKFWIFKNSRGCSGISRIFGFAWKFRDFRDFQDFRENFRIFPGIPGRPPTPSTDKCKRAETSPSARESKRRPRFPEAAAGKPADKLPASEPLREIRGFLGFRDFPEYSGLPRIFRICAKSCSLPRAQNLIQKLPMVVGAAATT